MAESRWRRRTLEEVDAEFARGRRPWNEDVMRTFADSVADPFGSLRRDYVYRGESTLGAIEEARRLRTEKLFRGERAVREDALVEHLEDLLSQPGFYRLGSAEPSREEDHGLGL